MTYQVFVCDKCKKEGKNLKLITISFHTDGNSKYLEMCHKCFIIIVKGTKFEIKGEKTK